MHFLLKDYVFNCDICEESDNTLEHSDTGKEPRTEADAEKLMRSVGWTIGKRDICPYCQKDYTEPESRFDRSL